MVREIITLNCGGCGIQFGQSVYERYCNEYSIRPNGSLEQKNDNSSIHTFFNEGHLGQYSGRNFFCDLDNNTLDNIKQNKYANIIPDHTNSVFGNQNGSNIFSYGYNSDIIQPFCDKLRTSIDACDNIQGFLINHSIVGNGAGLTAQILEQIGIDYRKKCKIGFEICPIPLANKDCNVLNPYNMAISMHKLIDYTEVSLMFDNNALYNITRKKLNIYSPKYEHLNEIISKCIAAFTYPLRQADADDFGRLSTLDGYRTHYVPFPRLHFLTPSMSPIQPKLYPITLIDGYVRESYANSYQIYNDIRYLLYSSYCFNEYKSYHNTIHSVTDNVLNSENFLMDYPSFDANEDLYMSCWMHYQCDNKLYIKERDVRNTCLQFKRSGEKIKFIDWVPQGFDCSLQQTKTYTKELRKIYGVMSDEDMSCFMFGNNTCFSKWCANRIIQPFNLLFDKRAYVHWFENNGIEETEFAETKEDLFFLQQDYNDVLNEEDESEYDYDENDYILSEMNEQQMIDQAIQNSLQ